MKWFTLPHSPRVQPTMGKKPGSRRLKHPVTSAAWEQRDECLLFMECRIPAQGIMPPTVDRSSHFNYLKITLTNIPRGPSSGEPIVSRLTIEINCYKNSPCKSESSLKEAASNHRLLKTGPHEMPAVMAPRVFDRGLPSLPEL